MKYQQQLSIGRTSFEKSAPMVELCKNRAKGRLGKWIRIRPGEHARILGNHRQ